MNTTLLTFLGFESAASAAIALQKYPDAQVRVSSASSIGWSISALKPKNVDNLFIMGVGVYCPRNEVIEPLKALLKSGCKVTWLHKWGDLGWLKKELKDSAGFTLIDRKDALLPQLAAQHLGIKNEQAKRLIALVSKTDKQEETRTDTEQALIDLAIQRYFKFEDYDAYPLAIRKLAGLEEITKEDRQDIKNLGGFTDRYLIGKSKALKELRKTIDAVGKDSQCRVLILGETGTGKETVARLIHEASNRRGSPFLAINCAAIPESLLESELFGHEKGAFTDARESKAGYFEMANGGTIFLDEVGEMPYHLQARLLRVLQEGSFIKVGGQKTSQVDVRVITATNRELLNDVKEKCFREDLYYRIAAISIKTPPLREHPEDIPYIASRIIHDLAEARDKDDAEYQALARKTLKQLKNYAWPGNVREMENVLERAVVLGDWNLKASLLESGQEKPLYALNVKTLKEKETAYIIQVYNHFEQNKSKTAKALGISLNTLKGKLNLKGEGIHGK
jgi:transcriptional regulator with PAS, ATPase and Fis domain